MAQVASETAVAADRDRHAKIDHYLDYELKAWRSVPDYATRWSQMEAIDQETFHLHWRGVTEGYLRELERSAGEGRLDAAQRACYRQLTSLVARHRPTLEALLAENPGT